MEVVESSSLLIQILIGWTFVALFTAILVVHRTALLGFTMFAAFHIASASHSALLWCSLWGITMEWVSPQHLVVYNYCGIGLILFAIGVFIAWKPLRISAAKDPTGQKNPISGDRAPSWLTPQFVLLCMFVGAAGYILTPITSRIPTVHAIWTIFFDWLNVGILIAGFYSGVTRRYKVVALSVLIFLPLGLIRVVGDGHAGALGMFLIQFGLVFFIARRAKFKELAILAVLLLALGPLATTWFKVRNFVRGGHIQGNVVQRVMTFLDLFGMYYEPFRISPYELLDVLRLRIDMTHIFTAQVRWQPNNEPYAHGKTFTENILIILVPRIIWKDKPVHFGGSEFIGRYTGMFRSAEDTTSVGAPINFEFYANFGPFGAMILMGLFGYSCARLELSLFNKNFRDLPKLMRHFVYTMVVCGTGSGVSMTVMKLVPGLVGVWMAGKVIENLRKSMRLRQDFLTPLPVKKKKGRVVVVGEDHGQGKVATVGQTAFRRRRGTLTPHASAAQPYGFRKWDGRPGRAPL